jgi:hypothetical protein
MIAKDALQSRHGGQGFKPPLMICYQSLTFINSPQIGIRMAHKIKPVLIRDVLIIYGDIVRHGSPEHSLSEQKLI